MAECLAALTRWRDRIGGLDCHAIARDSYFNPIRADLTFQAFLNDNGCGDSA